MKYFYISCLLLSSFFTYKTLSAKDNHSQYAFFMPQGAFEQNTTLDDIESMRPRQPKPTQTQHDTEQLHEEIPSPKITLPYVKKKIKIQEVTANKVKETPQITPPAPADDIKKEPEQPKQMAKPAPLTISPDIIEKLNKYSLESIAPENNTSKTTQKTTTLTSKQFTPQSLTQMLSAVPYPDPALPKFKQIYASYVMDLRIFNRRGNLPANPEQEQILQKANSIRRFDVK
ncbi:MAG: hypothetical protein J6C85_04565 [Alphaproteobacteria bacterium]|nr:hypothetical protein [Alphaproteobacteria bacterium]